MGGEEEKKKNTTTNNMMITAILSISAIFIHSVMSQKQRGEEVGGRHFAVSSLVCSNLRSRRQSQAQAGAIKAFNKKTARFSGRGGEGEAGLSEDHRRSTGNLKPGASAARWRQSRRSRKKCLPSFLHQRCTASVQQLPERIAAFVDSARSSSRCAAGHLASTPAPVLHSTEQRRPDPAPYLFTVAVSSFHTAQLVGKCENNQSIFFFFPRQSGDLVRSLTRFTLTHFCTAGEENIGKLVKIGAILGEEEEMSTATKTHLDLVSLCAAGHNLGGWREFVTFCAFKLSGWRRSFQHRTRKAKRRPGGGGEEMR